MKRPLFIGGATLLLCLGVPSSRGAFTVTGVTDGKISAGAGGIDFAGGRGLFYELDAYFTAGTSYMFSYDLLNTGQDLVLKYRLNNTSGSVLSGAKFFIFLDTEMDESINTYFNEYGVEHGTKAPWESWEIDEPGYAEDPGDIFQNYKAGTLDNTNALPQSLADDVSIAMGFDLDPIEAGGWAQVEILFSEIGNHWNPMWFEILDTDSLDLDLTISARRVSGGTVVPVPSAAILCLIGLLSGGTIQRRLSRRA